MCDFSARLVAWMDRELPDIEAAAMERHVRDCFECRRRVDAYQEVSRAFVAYCDAAVGAKTPRGLPQWVPVLSSAVAIAVLLLVFRTAFVKPIPVRPRVADSVQANVLAPAPSPVKKGRRRHVSSSMRTSNANWEVVEPAVRIAIPVEAMLPPGAVPEGITFIADLSIAADGSVQGLRLQQ
jgi:hypothetical protein